MMALFFFLGFLILLACGAYLAWNWQRRRQRLVQLLARLIPLTKSSGDHSRMYRVRTLGLNAFLGDQLINELEREVALLERERGMEMTHHLERPIFSSKERLKQLEERIDNIELEDEAIE